jgi:membrane protein implicated in regulation of membrane protease activity
MSAGGVFSFILLLLQAPQAQLPTPVTVKSWWENPALIIAGYVVTAGSLVLTWLSWWSARRAGKPYRYLMEVAERNIDKSATEEQLRSMQEQVRAESGRIEQLQQKIRRDIPIEAKRAVLLDRLNHQVEALDNTMTSVRRLKADLAAIGTTPDLPPELLKAVESEISPEYRLERRRRSLQVAISIIMSFAGLLPVVFRYYFEEVRLISAVLVAAGAVLSIILLRTYVRRWKRPRKHVIFTALAGVLLTGDLFATLLYGILYRDITHNATFRSGAQPPATGPFSELLPLLVFIIVVFGIALASLLYARISRRRQDTA